ncbi:hypothetical protein J2I47_18515 [Fibrella sp. HMF5335]|uniref:Uncharacterized protein n=1 Tax=Fibrella rubiginis TaxID=2817060 RepID=A0A939GLD7_9BACT|nr:hypothetical protein [Fibrella rubiginis]MBO0938552.1 hypothetical protein [Fibrella rubiginis]
MIPSTIQKTTVLALLAACGLLTVSVSALLWVNSRRVAHYNDEINDLRRHVATADGQVQRLSQKLEDCLTVKKSHDSARKALPLTRGWE